MSPTHLKQHDSGENAKSEEGGHSLMFVFGPSVTAFPLAMDSEAGCMINLFGGSRAGEAAAGRFPRTR